MAANDRPKLGGAFSRPDRTSGIGGLLSQPASASSAPAAPAAEPSPAPVVEPTAPSEQETTQDSGEGQAPSTQKATPAAEPRRRTRRPGKSRGDRSATALPAGPEDVPRVVPVVLDAPVLASLREAGRQSGLTHGLIALGAIENHADELGARWSSGATRARGGSLFGRTQPQHRRSEPGVQTQLRVAAGDADVLDDLVARWSAPSRSALVNDALILELDKDGRQEAGS